MTTRYERLAAQVLAQLFPVKGRPLVFARELDDPCVQLDPAVTSQAASRR